MNIEKILAEYDSMFGKNTLPEIEAFLAETLREAKKQSETGIVIAILNEIIGFCRDTTQREKALAYGRELLEIMQTKEWEGTIEYATSLLNIANAYRAFGLLKESLEFYGVTLDIFKVRLDKRDFRFASLYNNWSLLYQEMEDYENAKEMLMRALAIVDSYEDATIPRATTRTNLAATLIQIGTKEAYKEAMEYLEVALGIFEGDGGKDFHYGAALVVMGDACMYQKNYEEAASYYERGLLELEKHVGRNDNYNRVLEKYKYAQSFLEKESKWISNLERSKKFYEHYGREMIHTHFPEYEDRIAVGLVGEGSDCFGFDDEISKDHDYAVGFCMWLTEEDYHKIGAALQKEYDRLIENYNRETCDVDEGKNDKNNAVNHRFLKNRRGVFSIDDFYNGILKTDYENIDECDLATATNGMVFQDSLGMFSAVREKLLDYYPQSVWRRKLAESLHEFSQYAQSNYPRMMARKDLITARLCIGKAMESAMNLVYLLEKTYSPYYKWKRKGMETLALGKRILPLLEEIARTTQQTEAWEGVSYDAADVNSRDACVVLFEKIAEVLLEEMKAKGLVQGNTLFLETYIGQILEGKNMDIIKSIIELEWQQFDKVKNEGGRADCQDDFNTFSIMRKSQYLAWPGELLESYCNDLLAAENKGWNLIMEKYARMMASTAPEKYEELKKDLPLLSRERIVIQEEIIKIQVTWMEEFAKQYPKMAGNSRSIHTYEDNAYNTSYETYLRGELGTYSENTFVLYGRFVAALTMEQRNLACEIMGNTVKLYGYHSLEDAENRL